LETEEDALAQGKVVVVPTIGETLRIKAYFIVSRNQVRDYLDVVALAEKMGIEAAAGILVRIDDYYSDLNRYSKSIASELVDRLSDPNPKDSKSIDSLDTYKGLATKYQSWQYITDRSKELALEMIKHA
jgi:hypothetical protein